MNAQQRWVMRRAGLFNFWYYIDETFELSSGRLLFRGANGSGKSVTMQSFLPLVLDGDKRAHRLDPFGSKDRKIEYYLLGDNGEKADAIAYLWLEFVRPDTGRSATVGIGLRARRGGSAVEFWGFAVTDGRRIGEDLFVYDRERFERYGEKQGLLRADLERAIGAGGKVVKDQKEYRALVNTVLFGFADVEAYKDLLDLLIQLRSPKLSKEFKPSTIYGILNSALPPLSEEELRPLSDVLEDMDEIGDRLDELRRHREDAQTLEAAYEQYNEMRLYELAGATADAAKGRDRAAADAERAARELAAKAAERERLAAASDEAAAAERREKAALEALQSSEAAEKERELASKKSHLSDVRQELGRSRERLRRHEEERSAKAARSSEAAAALNEQELLRTEKVEELDGIAADIEFADHHAYARQWSLGGDGRGGLEAAQWTGWRRDVEAYRAALKETLALCEREREARRDADEAEKALGSARERRDAAERDVRSREAALEAAIRETEDRLFGWFRGLKELTVDENAWRAAAGRLQRYPELDYRAALQPIQDAADRYRADAGRRELALRHDRGLRLAERERLEAELAEWRRSREPEPARSDARKRLRARLSAGSGAPLYACVDFRDGVDGDVRARLEDALAQAGLIDAWVPAAGADVGPAAALELEEDVWLRPGPMEFGYTLADLLEPAPSAESGLTTAEVEAVLHSIRIGASADEGRASVSEDGRYAIGPLEGKAAGKPAAEWIGAEARKAARLAAIRRLEEAIAAEAAAIGALDAALAELAERLEAAEREFAALPDETPLRQAKQALESARSLLEGLKRIEDECDERHRTLLQKWRETQRALQERTAAWTRLRTHRDFTEALDSLRVYEGVGQELKSILTTIASCAGEIERLAGDIARLEAQMADEETQIAALRAKESELSAGVEALQKILEELGILDLHERMEAAKHAIERAAYAYQDAQNGLMRVNRELGALEAAASAGADALAAAERALEGAAARLYAEWKLDLLHRDDDPHPLRGVDIGSASDAVRAAASIVTALKKYANRNAGNVADNVRDAFFQTRNAMQEYVLELRYLEQGDGRLVIESMRDRNAPLPPRRLLQELRKLEEEQKLLIDEKDRELYEQILIHSVGRAIKDKINRAEAWVDEMNRFMGERRTSSKLNLELEWKPRPARNERELDTDKLVKLLRKNPTTLLEEETSQMVEHFRSRIRWAKEDAENGATLRSFIAELLDYRLWFDFTLYHRKGEQPRKELTDARFNVLSGGEKAMAMYIPLFAATDSRYKDSRPEAPRLISLDEAFAGVDEENVKDMFELLTDMRFDYMMTSQALWGCYETVPALSIYQIVRPLDGDVITLIPYYWNGRKRTMVADGGWPGADEAAAGREASVHE